jgi:hypothetical protein
MRASLMLVFLLGGCGGVKECKDGTLLVEVELTGDAQNADSLAVDVATANLGMGDPVPLQTQLSHTPGVGSGFVEVDFPAGYPVGAAVTVTLTATRHGQILGRSLAIALLRPGCDTTMISIGDANAGDAGRGATDGGLLPADVAPTDPEFKDQKAWTLAGGAVIDPTAPGLDDVGELILDRGAVCTSAGSAYQSIVIPSFAAAGPLALIHTAQRTCATKGLDCTGGNAAVRFRDGAIAFAAGSALSKAKTCLGARAFAGTFDFLVAAGDKNDCADPMLSALELRVDRLSISPDPTCPAPETIVNGNFEGTAGDWLLQLNNGSATIDPGIGEGGSQAGHITTSHLCQSPKLRGTQSVPMGDQVALSLLVKGTAGKAALVGEETNQARWASMTGSGVFETPRVCVPEYAKGMVLPLLLSTETPQGACATLDVRDFVFDDLTFVTEPSCPKSTFVIDPGFERHSTVAQWNLSVDADGSVGQVAATVVQDATQAHSGTAALRLSTKQFCTSAHANTVITVPQPVAAGGPAIKFFHRAALINNTIGYATVQGAQVKLTQSAAYQQSILCLDPARAGQGQYFEVVLSSSGICGHNFPEESAYFDDFEATTDPSCPTK